MNQLAIKEDNTDGFELLNMLIVIGVITYSFRSFYYLCFPYDDQYKKNIRLQEELDNTRLKYSMALVEITKLEQNIIHLINAIQIIEKKD